MALAVIDELGADLERAWAAAAFEGAAFPGISGERLSAWGLHAKVDPDDIIRAVFRADLPRQVDPDARFGQPPVTLYRAEKFFIDALFWVDGTTTIHDHAFAGAFQVLAGQSIETTYSFQPSREDGGAVRVGELHVRQSELRVAGDVRAVPAGPAYIHSLFHLARPSVTLVVRTYTDTSAGRQFAYSPAGLAFDSQLADPVRDRIVQAVEMLRRTEHPRFEAQVGDLVASADLHVAFSIIRSCAKLCEGDVVDRLATRIEDADARGRMRAWVSSRRRMQFLLSRRGLVQPPPLRFLLAILLNARRRRDALALAARFAPGGDPAAQIAAWLRELGGITMRLQVGGAPFEPNVLGLPAFEAGCEEALAAELAGRTPAASPEVQAFIQRLRGLPVLEPLFAGDDQ